MTYGSTMQGILGGGALKNLVISLWTGNATERDIVTNQNMASNGGLVIVKARTEVGSHLYFDSERGANKYLQSNDTNAEQSVTQHLNSFNANGYTIGTDNTVNKSSIDYVGWSFQQALGFMDIVTWSGDGSDPRSVAHNLGATPGMCITRELTETADWYVWHKDLDPNELKINTTGVAANSITDFSVDSSNIDLGLSTLNQAATDYVAYVFAHNPAKKVYCGTYTGNGSSSGPSVSIGFRPRFVMIKNADLSSGATNWRVMDVERNSFDNIVNADEAVVEATSDYIDVNDDGFDVVSANDGVNASGDTMAFIAIG